MAVSLREGSIAASSDVSQTPCISSVREQKMKIKLIQRPSSRKLKSFKYAVWIVQEKTYNEINSIMNMFSKFWGNISKCCYLLSPEKSGGK